jgi:hypothetical protein
MMRFVPHRILRPCLWTRAESRYKGGIGYSRIPPDELGLHAAQYAIVIAPYAGCGYAVPGLARHRLARNLSRNNACASTTQESLNHDNHLSG